MNEDAKNFSNKIDYGNKLLDRLEESVSCRSIGNALSLLVEVYSNSSELLDFERNKKHLLRSDTILKFSTYTARESEVARVFSDVLEAAQVAGERE